MGIRTTTVDDTPTPNDTGTGSVSLTTVGVASIQNFDTLSNTAGSTTNTTLPTGWYITETGGGARDNEQYAVDTGGSNTGDTYSYGAAAATDRALGGLRSGTLISVFGAMFTNNTGSTITSLDIAYTGEEWRLGTAARTDQIDFQISTNATDLSTGTYTDVNALDFVTPNTVTIGAKDGNNAANRTALGTTVSSLSIANGASFFIRWTDLDATGADDGLAVDDFSITPQGAGGGGMPSLSINDVTMNEGNPPGTTTFTFAVTLNAPAGAGGVTFDIATADGTAQDGNPGGEDNDYVAQSLTGQSIPMGSTGPYNFNVTVNRDTTPEPNETFFVNVTNVTGATVADGQGQGTITNDDFSLTPIHTIQGSGDTTPIPGATVTTNGIVTLLKTGSNAGAGAANGFFLQTPDADADADPNTSQGIFVFTSSVPTVAVGDNVNVTGTVVEFNGLTEISPTTNVSINSTGNPLPTAVALNPTILDPTLSGQPQLEKFEAMRMSAASLTSGAPNDNFFDVYAVITGVARPLREPGIPISDPVPPDPTSGMVEPTIPRWDENPERLKLDTNGRAGAANMAYTSNVTFTNVAGPLDFAFSEYRLVTEAGFSASLNLSAVPVPVPLSNEFTIVGYNIENFNNNATQRQKAALTIRNVLHYPDIIGAVEIFDLADLQALRDQINNDAVAAMQPNPMYEAYLIEQDGVSEDNDQDVGFLVKTARVSVTSVTQERQAETFVEPGGGTAILHDRPPLVLDAVVDPSGANPRRVLVVVNHTRSFIDIDLVAGDGPRVREKRKKQAESIAGLLQELQTNNPGVPVVSVGDYNAFQFSSGYDDSISVLKGMPTADELIVVDQSPDLVNPDFFNLIDELPVAERYSFVFEGTPQALDHVLVNGTARARNTRTAIARVNADFPASPASAYASNASIPERNSDHDPVVAYFTLGQPQPAGTLIISEFRLRGPAGVNDEFVELYNNTDADITVSTVDGSAGWAVVSADNTATPKFTIPNGTIIPARGHYLGVNSNGYTLANYGGTNAATGDVAYTTDIPDNTGLALFNTANSLFFTMENRLDAVGPTSEMNAIFKEGAGIPALTSMANVDHAFYRDLRNGTPKDTGDNAADFIFVSVDGMNYGAGALLGAPGPENLTSPIQRNATMPVLLLDATTSGPQPPNRVRDFASVTNGMNGTLSIRRRVVNNTGQNVTRLRFRLVNFTTFPAPPGTADLRAITSMDVLVSGIMDMNTCTAAGAGSPPCAVNVQGTMLEEPPTQASGGGWNSTLSVPVSMSPGDSVSVQFLLGVQQSGAFRFFFNVEAVTESILFTGPRGSGKSGNLKKRVPR